MTIKTEQKKTALRGKGLSKRYGLSSNVVLAAMANWLCPCMILASLVALPSCSNQPLGGPQTVQSDDPPAGKTVEKQSEKQPAQFFHILKENEARQIATTFLNEQLKGRQFLAPSGMVDFVPINAKRWESIVYDYRQRRIVLRFGGYGGWEALVSFAGDGSDPKVEHAEMAWD